VTGRDGIVRVWEARLLRDPVWLAAIEREGIEPVADWWT
jgi:chitin disaccharide deacetylase